MSTDHRLRERSAAAVTRSLGVRFGKYCRLAVAITLACIGVNSNLFAQDSTDTSMRYTQLTNDPRKPLDRRIESMPRAEEKLEVIEHHSQLMVTRAPIRRIAWSDPDTIDIVQFSETEFAVAGQALGSTDLWLWFEGQAEPLMYVVTVIRDPALEEQRKIDYGRIQRRLALMYPNSKVYLIPMFRKVVVRGQARDAREAASIMNIIRTEVIAQEGGNLYGLLSDANGAGGYAGGGAGVAGIGNNSLNNLPAGGFVNAFIVDELEVPGEFQIKIRVRIAEINRSQLRRLGVDWDVLWKNGAYQIAQTAFAPGGTLTGIFDNGNITVVVDALASNGVAKVLEDAYLITLSGESAAFLAGGEFAVPTIIGIAGAQGQSTSFRGFGTSIICTPTLIDRDNIRLQIVPELSSINNGNAVGGIPGLNVRRVQTRVDLREGQSVALGGLFSRREKTEVSRIPFLGEIPIVGPFFFHGKESTEDENELLIIVTPEIVRPMDADQVPPLPGWYSTHPDDIDLYKYNRTEGNPDLGNYQLLPYGNGQGYGRDAGYNFFNPAPAPGGPAPLPTGGTAPQGWGGPDANGEVPPGVPAESELWESGQQPYPSQPGLQQQSPTQPQYPAQGYPPQNSPAQGYPAQGYPEPASPQNAPPVGAANGRPTQVHARNWQTSQRIPPNAAVQQAAGSYRR